MILARERRSRSASNQRWFGHRIDHPRPALARVRVGRQLTALTFPASSDGCAALSATCAARFLEMPSVALGLATLLVVTMRGSKGTDSADSANADRSERRSDGRRSPTGA